MKDCRAQVVAGGVGDTTIYVNIVTMSAGAVVVVVTCEII